MSNLAPIEAARLQVFSPAVRTAFEAAICDQHMKFETEAGFAMQVMQTSDFLAKIAAQNVPSLRAAITNVAAIGVSLNPARKQAYLVPRKVGGQMSVCLDISYMGLMDLAMDTGAIQWGQARIVRRQDSFELRGLDQPPVHSYDPFSTERGNIVGVYVVVKTASGDYLTHAMPISAVHAIRDRSEAWKAYVREKKSCPWVTDEEEMIKKTCVKQAFKYWPKNTRLDAAVRHLNTDGGEGLAERDMGSAEVVTVNATDILDEINKINDLDTLRTKKAEWNKLCLEAKDLNAWGLIKGAISVRVTELTPAQDSAA